MILTYGPAKGSKQHPYLLLTPQVSLGMLHHMAHEVEQPSKQSGLVGESSPVPGHT